MSARSTALLALRGEHDLETEAGRSRERWRRIALAAVGAAGFRAVSVLGTLVTLPLVIGYLGTTGTGLFTVMTTLVTLLAFSDLGIGNGLVTALARATGAGDHTEARRLVASAAFLLVGVAVVLGVVAALVVPAVDWAQLLNVGPSFADQARPSVAVFAVCFLVGVPASLAQKVHLGLQEGLAANLWSLAGAVLSIVMTVACVLAHASVPWLVAATVGSTTLAGLANCAVLFGRRRRDLAPHRRDVDRRAVLTLARLGGLFFVLVSASALAYQTDALVISAVLGVEEVTPFSVVVRLFSLPLLAVTIMLTPLWPAYGDAMARGDSAWLRRSLHRSTALSLAVVAPSSLLLLAFGRPIVHAWVGSDVTPPLLLFAALAAWNVLNAVTQPMAMLFNGAGVVTVQVVAAIVMTVVNVALSVVLTRHVGLSGPVLGSLVAAFLCSLLPALVVVRGLLRRLDLSPAAATP